MSPNDFLHWLADANRTEHFVYHIGLLAADVCEDGKAARNASVMKKQVARALESGVITTVQKRQPDGQMAYVAIKLKRAS